MAAIFPNTFLIGVQKAGTTSVDHWLAQHPDIYGYSSLKDVHLFGLYATKKEIEERLEKEQVHYYEQQKIVLQSAVNYIFYPGMLRAIKRDAPGSKLILVLRNPVERAVSAYFYFKKMYREKRSPEEALIYKAGENFSFSKDNNDFTYIEHGLYFRQLTACLEIFDREKLLILDYEELKRNPQAIVKRLYQFLEIDTLFQPDLKPKNITGEIRNKWLQKQLVKNSHWKTWLIRHFMDPWLPSQKRNLLKRKMFERNTLKSMDGKIVEKERETVPNTVKDFLVEQFREDVKSLDRLLQTNYSSSWLQQPDISKE